MIELSVIIPTHNRAEQLRHCLEALSHQSQPADDFDVIVVDDGSTDGTAEMLAQLKTPFRLRVMREAKLGQCAARNRGVANAAPYCLFLDDDVIAGPDLVAEHLKAQRAAGGVIAIGQLTVQDPASADWYARRFAQRWRDHFKHLNRQTRALSWQDCFSGNLSVPRQVVLEVGGFATDLPASFDAELAYRLHQRGLALVYVPAARGEHRDDKPGHHLLRDDVRAGRMLPELIRRHPELSSELLDAFWDTSRRAVLLRRLLLALSLAPSLLARLGPLAPNAHWKREWFKFVNAYAYWYGVRQSVKRDEWRRMLQRTPILMYHAFGRSAEPLSRYILPVGRFEQQMAWLKRLGYRVLSLEDFLRYQHESRSLPARSVVITIDDGYADNYELAYPVLRRYGFPATIFLVSERVGDANRWDKEGPLTGRPIMTWAHIHEMQRNGVTFGSHTRTHARLSSISPDQARQEIEGSRADLERSLGAPVKLLAYPFGAYNDTARTIVEQAGFEGACSTRPGLNTLVTPRFDLRRIEIRGTDSLVHFIRCLWFGSAQVPRRK